MKRNTIHPPTDEEILSYRNVPVDIAALYLGWTRNAIYDALQDGRASFGTAVQGKSHWTHHISPGGLVKYQHEGANTYGLKDLQQIMADGVEQILEAKLTGLNQVLASVTASA